MALAAASVELAVRHACSKLAVAHSSCAEMAEDAVDGVAYLYSLLANELSSKVKTENVYFYERESPQTRALLEVGPL